MNEIKLDNTLIHIPNSWRHGNLYVYLTWDKYRIVRQNGEVIQEDFCPYLNKKRAIDMTKIPYSRYWKYLLGRIQSYLGIDNLRLLYQRINRLLGLLAPYTMIEFKGLYVK